MKNKADGSWMIYGATGFTGTLIAEEAVRRGHRPILAGRNVKKLQALGERLGLAWQAFSLEDVGAVFEAAESIDLVLNAAGPFTKTCEPLMDACLAGKSHYLDISNEIPVLHAAQARHRMAEENGVSIIPGVGFGTVASNCLARHVCDQITEPVSLEIILSPYVAQRSAGAARSTLETIAHGGYVRKEGKLVSTPFGSGAKRMRIASAWHTLLPVPTGDLEAAYMATGIPDITVYMVSALNPILARSLLPLVQKILSWEALRQKLARWLDARPTSSKPVNANRRSWIWARAADRHGKMFEARLETGDGYEFTALASIQAIEQVMRQQPIGIHSPATAFGADFVLRIDGVRRNGGVDQSEKGL
ncbi:MAG: saccharopine dehydrogenase NADP-binding domain-containing protein [Nitrosomonadales bacterium]|nr:saccharopine dehydrogenase NADP-binding domain-containing protein [Nitrosomonadales bacterium]